MVNTQQATAVYVRIPNEPGPVAEVARLIADLRINVDAVSYETVGETGFARFYTFRPQDVLPALRERGYDVHESLAVLASLPDRPGALARATSELAAAGVNVEAVTTTTDGRLAFRTGNNDYAEQILQKL